MSKSRLDVFSEELLAGLSHPTPFFLFSKNKIKDNFKKYQELFPGAMIYFAMKSNSDPGVLKTLNEIGSGFEVASYGELELLKKISVKPNKIIYGTSVKPVDHIKRFFEYGINRFAADSLQEIDKIASVAPKANIYIRTIANDSGSVFKFSEKFGTESENIVPLLLHAKKTGLVPYGISFHVGSQAGDPMAWANAISMLKPILRELKDRNVVIKTLNLGGGYPCKYASSETVPDLSEIAGNIYQEYVKLPIKPKLILEPGRGMIANTGVFIGSVIARVERSGGTWLFLDAGVYNGLFETMAYQGSTRYSVTSLRSTGDAGASMFSLAGPTGDSPDVITREALLPADIEVGDKLVFHNAGAYSLSVVSQFNGFPKPKAYLI